MRRAIVRPLDAEAAPDHSGSATEGVDDLYRSHGAWLTAILKRRFGRSLGSEVDDVVQETYVRVSRRAPQDGLGDPRAFLAKIAHRLMLDEIRRRRRAEQAVADAGVCGAAVQDADQETALNLKQAVMSLPPALREVLLLHRVAGLDYPAIARRCGISVKTVEWRMSQALKHCRRHVSSAAIGSVDENIRASR